MNDVLETRYMPSLVHQAARFLTRAYPFLSGQGDLVQISPLNRLRFSEEKLVVQLDNGLRVVVFPNDVIGRRVYFFGDVDRKITALLNAVLQPGDTFIDVGANVGIVSAQCLPGLGRAGRVVAVEPQALCARAIGEMISLNGISNLEVHALAISDRNGTGRMKVEEPGNLGSASLKAGPAREPGEAGDEVATPIRDAGEFLEGLRIVGDYAVKIDVEGHEAEILVSAAHYFEVHLPKAVLFESWTSRKDSPLNERFRLIESHLSRLGLSLFKIRKTLWSPRIESLVDGQPDPSASDYVALRPDVEERLRELRPRWLQAARTS